jgi:hypothetical protein
MTPTERGAFCDKCSRDLFDFTRMSDDQIIQIIASGQSVCGRFRSDQLNRDFTLVMKPNRSFNWKFLIAIPALFIAGELSSQVPVTDSTENNIEWLKTLDGDSVIIISGQLLDTAGFPVANGSLVLENGKRFTSDSTGHFEITTTYTTGTEASFHITAEYNGLAEKVKITTTKSLQYNIQFKLAEVVVTAPHTKCRIKKPYFIMGVAVMIELPKIHTPTRRLRLLEETSNQKHLTPGYY